VVARFVIEYTDNYSVESIIDLIARAGRVGVGEWRPEKGGTYGTFVINKALTAEEIDETIKRCAPMVKELVIPEWAMDVELDPHLLQKVVAGEMPDPEDGEEEQPKMEDAVADLDSLDEYIQPSRGNGRSDLPA
jgi:hypothetical protein